MVRRTLLVAAVLGLLGACAAPELSAADTVRQVRQSMASAGIRADSVRLVSPAPAGTYRAVARVAGGEVTVTMDRRTGSYRRIEVGPDARVTDRQVRALAAEGGNPGASSARLRTIAFVATLVVAVAAAGLVLARRARLREARGETTLLERSA